MKLLGPAAAPLLRLGGAPPGAELVAATPPSAVAAPDTTAWVLFALTYLAYIAIYFARKPVSVCKSTLESQLGLSRASLGVIDTALLASYAAGQLLLGQVVKTLGSTTPLILAYAVCGLCTMAFGSASSPGVMAALWGGSGFFAAAANPLMVIFVADLFPASARGSIIGLWQTSQQAGGIAANTVASAMLATKGWRAAFHLSGGVVLAFAPVLALALRAKASGAPAVPAKARSGAAPAAAAAGGATSVSALPGVASVGAAYTLVKMARYCLMFWAPYFLSRHVGMSAAASGVAAAIFDLGGVAGGVLGGVLTDSVFGGRMIAVTLPFVALTGAAFAAWALLCVYEAGGPPSASLHMAAMAVVGFLIAAPDGILGGAASKNLCDYAGLGHDKRLAAAASGMVNGCGSIGAIVQGFLTAQLVDAVGWRGLFASLALCMLATSAALLPAVRVEARALATPR